MAYSPPASQWYAWDLEEIIMVDEGLFCSFTCVKCLNLIDFYLLNVIKFSVNLQGRKYRKVKIFKRNI